MNASPDSFVLDFVNYLKKPGIPSQLASLPLKEAVPSTAMNFSLENVRRLIKEPSAQSTTLNFKIDTSSGMTEQDAANAKLLGAVLTNLSGDMNDLITTTRARISEMKDAIDVRILFKNGSYGSLRISRSSAMRNPLTLEGGKSVDFTIQGNRSPVTEKFKDWYKTDGKFDGNKLRSEYPLEINL